MADKKTTKKVSKKEVEVKTLETLRTDLVTKKNDHLDAKRSHAAGELINPRAITVLRKEIARLNTAIRAAELAELKERK